MTTSGDMEMEQDLMRALLEAFEQSDWQEMTVTVGGDRLHVSRRESSNGAAPAPARSAATSPAEPPTAGPPLAQSAPDSPQASAEPAATTPITDTQPSSPPPAGTTVTSPSVGLFWRAPSPGAPPFIEVGAPVAAGDTVAIVEVMKLMNHVTAPVSGTVIAVLPENGEAVEFGQVLAVIDPEA
jgi:acetyl-CoA carboxylase biotin carboxyl carrier protein